jgi:RNA polymerase sigma-70 factor (ECF subfamily)
MKDDRSEGAEAALIRRAQRGDPAAFEQIYERHQGQVYRYVLYRVRDIAIAEDLTSEVFVRLVEQIGRFRYRGRPILAWLYTIARHLVTDHFRAQGQLTELPEDDCDPLASRALSDWRPERALERQALMEALSQLTEEQRMVILLKFVEGMDNRSVAATLGKPVSAVKSLQHRALARLSRLLHHERQEDG